MLSKHRREKLKEKQIQRGGKFQEQGLIPKSHIMVYDLPPEPSCTLTVRVDPHCRGSDVGCDSEVRNPQILQQRRAQFYENCNTNQSNNLCILSIDTNVCTDRAKPISPVLKFTNLLLTQTFHAKPRKTKILISFSNSKKYLFEKTAQPTEQHRHLIAQTRSSPPF